MDICPAEDRYIDMAFSQEGWLAQVLPGYRPRTGQIQMARAVDTTIVCSSTVRGTTEEGDPIFSAHRLLIEAPTGVGKSMAYLIPASYHAARTKQKVVVATANIALQEQLMDKDLPLVAATVPWAFSYGLLKGRSNYACLYMIEKTRRRDWASSVEREEAERIYEWLATTEKGDSGTLPFQPSAYVWNQFSVSGEECLGKACDYHGTCFANRARLAVANCDVVVTNYHLLLTNVLTHGKSLPVYQHLILDEAHKLVDIARDFFGFSLSEAGFMRLIRNLRSGDQRFSKRAVSVIISFFGQVEAFRTSGDYKIRLRRNPNFDFASMIEVLAEARTIYLSRRSVLEPDSKAAVELRMLADQCKTAIGRLRIVQNLEAEKEDVFFLEETRGGRAKICSKKLDVSALLASSLFQPLQSVVATSATLTVNQDFSYVGESMGLPKADCVTVDSPFDWPRQAYVIVPLAFPDPRHPAYRQEVGKALVDIVSSAKGRTLALFTSWAGLNVAYAALQGNTSYRILRQGDMPRGQLVDAFRRDVNSVLLGVESMWQGVDVQGESLSCLVIDKLPFPSHEDPILDALEERDPHTFFNYSVPRAVLALKQGFGRLIRSSQDKGVVVILDSRIHQKWTSYGKAFIDSLPPTGRGTDLADIKKVLA